MSKLRVVLDGAGEMVPRAIGITGDACGGKLRMLILPPVKSWCGIWRSKTATLWGYGEKHDSPTPMGPPERDADPEARLAEHVALAQSFSEGAVLHRGIWRGSAVCDATHQLVSVELRRALTSYGELVVFSDRESGWAWRWEGKSRWFQQEGRAAQGSLGPQDEISLQSAIQWALFDVDKPISAACSTRDQYRREAFDRDYEAIKPIKPPREHFRGVERPKIQPMAPQAPTLNWSGLLHRWTELPFAGPAPSMRRIDVSSPAKDRDEDARSLVRALPVGVGPDWAIGVLTNPWRRWPRGTIVARPPGNTVQWMYARQAEEALVDGARAKPAPKAPSTRPREATPHTQAGQGLVTARAQVTGSGYVVVMDGPYRESTFQTYEPVPAGADVVQIEFHPDDQFAHIVQGRPRPAQTVRGEITARAQVTGAGVVVVMEGPYTESTFSTYEPIPKGARSVMIRFQPDDQYAHIVSDEAQKPAAEVKPPKAQKPAAEVKPPKAQKPAAEVKPPKAQKPAAEDRQLLLDGFRDVLRRAPDLED